MKRSVKVLYFEADEIARLDTGKLIDGFIKYDNKLFTAEKTKPINLKTKLGSSPLYIIHNNSILPFDFKGTELTPEELENIVNQRIVRVLLKPVRKGISGGGNKIFLVIIAFALAYLLTQYYPQMLAYLGVSV